MAKSSASHMQLYDEEHLAIGGPMPIDLSVLDRQVFLASGEAEFPFHDGIYRSLGHIGNFVFGLQRVRRTPGLAPDPEPAMDMSRLGTSPA